MKKIFNHKNFKEFSNRYLVYTDGQVFNKETGNFLTIHQNIKSGMKFIRLSAPGGYNLSIGLNKLLLLTYKGNKYKKGKIAIAKDGNCLNISLNNLKWGTRKKQSKIAMKNPIYFKRVQKMGEKFGPSNGSINGVKYGKFNFKTPELSQSIKNKIRKMLFNGKTQVEISKKLGVSKSSIYRHK